MNGVVGGNVINKKQRAMGNPTTGCSQTFLQSCGRPWEDIHPTEAWVKVSGKAGHFASKKARFIVEKVESRF